MSKRDLADYLRNRQQALDLSEANIIAKSGITHATWQRVLTGDIDEAKLSTLMKLANVLQTHPMILVRILLMDNPELEQTTEAYQAGYNIHFVKDVTYPDNSFVGTGERFIKVWEVVNIGVEAWDNLYLQCMDESITSHTQPANQDSTTERITYGLQPDETRIAIPYTLPNQSVQLAVPFTAPNLPCSTISHWKIVDAQGHFLFPRLHGVYCMVKVVTK